MSLFPLSAFGHLDYRAFKVVGIPIVGVVNGIGIVRVGSFIK